MSKYLYKNNNFSITKREVGMSFTMIAIWILIGVIISTIITTRFTDDKSKYDKALKVNTAEIFDYGMETNVGDAFVYGKLKAVDTVKDKYLKGEYLEIYRVEQRYTRHTRTVRSGKTFHTKTYYTWDSVDKKDFFSKKVIFCGKEFPIKKFNLEHQSEYKDTIEFGFRRRYKYYVIEKEIKGTIFTSLKNNNISDNSTFYANKSINNTIDYLESDSTLIFFWIGWIFLLIILVCIFFYIDNDWLD